MSAITTHVLDTSHGRPAAGIAVHLERAHDGAWQSVGRAVTDDDGRVRSFTPAAVPLASGVYRLTFETGAYFDRLSTSTFYPQVTIAFRVTRGPRFLIRQIVVPDGLFLGRERILLLLDLRSGTVRRDAALNAARERLLVEYVALGFYAVNVGFAFADPATLPTGDVAVDAVLQVNEGPRGVVRAIRFDGARAIPDQRAFPSSDPSAYAFPRSATHRNIYRIPVP